MHNLMSKSLQRDSNGTKFPDINSHVILKSLIMLRARRVILLEKKVMGCLICNRQYQEGWRCRAHFAFPQTKRCFYLERMSDNGDRISRLRVAIRTSGTRRLQAIEVN